MIRIRPARVDEAGALATVHVQSWQAAYGGLIPQGYLDNLSVARRQDGWKRILAATAWPSMGTLVAEVDGRVVAFVSISPSRDEDQDSARVGEVTSIYALPEEWGRGVGRALMNSAIATLIEAGFSSATLWVLAGNARARRFYESCSWRPDGAMKQEDRGEFVLEEIRYTRDLGSGRAIER